MNDQRARQLIAFLKQRKKWIDYLKNQFVGDDIPIISTIYDYFHDLYCDEFESKINAINTKSMGYYQSKVFNSNDLICLKRCKSLQYV